MSATKLYLTKRPNKQYYICIKFSDGRVSWKTTGTTKKSEALTFLNTFKVELEQQSVKKIPTYSEFLKMFFTVNANTLRSRTLFDYDRHSKIFLSLVGDKIIDKYTSNEFEQIRAKKIADGWGITTANIFTRTIKSIFVTCPHIMCQRLV